MSEQFSLQPEDVESANDRLDSILDRLQALGASADAMKAAPLRPLQSVPDLPPSALEPIAEADAQAHVSPPTELTPPAVPDLGVVPSLEPIAAPAIETTTEAPAESIVEDIAVDEVVETPVEPVVDELVETPVEPVVDEVVEAPVDAWGDTLVESDESSTVVDPLPETDPPLVVDAPASMFDLLSAPAETEPAPAADPVVPNAEIAVEDASDLDGWVSHHDVRTDGERADESADFFEAPEFPVEQLEAIIDTTNDDWDSSADEELEAAWADEVEPAPTEDATDLAEEHAIDEASTAHAEQMDLSQESDPAHDFFAAMAESDEPVAIAGIDHLMDTTDLYETDEDLPLPDFTGVYTEPSADDAADAELALPDPVETTSTGSSGSAVRDELDRLRPAEEEAVAVQESGRNLSLRLQFFSVLAFGIMALVVVWLNDPSFVEDIQRSIENLLD